MAFGIPIQPIVMVLLPAVVLWAGCGNQPPDHPENEKTGVILRNADGESESSHAPDWGHEINLDEMIAMAKKGQIVEIQWHVMPNMLRAQATDGEIYHLRNENKGVDLRNTLIKEGITIGKGGILFTHLF